MSAPTYILYHAHCCDGFAAACVAHVALGGSAEYRPVQYGHPLPEIPSGARVFILDFSYPRAALSELAQRCEVVVLDHHATAEAELRGLAFARFESEKCGAVMAWEYFREHFPDAVFGAVPALLEYVQDRDLWKWELPESKAINAALGARPRKFAEWLPLLAGGQATLAQLRYEGQIVLRVQESQIGSINRRARMIPWVDAVGTVHPIPCVNTPILQSECCHELLQQHSQAWFAAAYFDEPGLDETSIARVWSLRGRGQMDVSSLAKAYGGGGHHNAAGFTQYLDALDVLRDPRPHSLRQPIAITAP